MSVPTPPQIRLRPKATDGTLEFWWGPPVSDGGSAILFYTIDIPGVYTDTVGAGVGYYKISGLTNGVTYTATVIATNAIGNSDPAIFRSVQPGLPPSAPQTQAATRDSSTSATVSWTPPASDGGATIGWNVISCYPLDSSGAIVRGSTLGDQTSLVIPDLSANTTYTVLVRARNDPAYSPKSVYIAPLTYGAIPSDISGLRLWLDAADLTTLFSDVSGAIPSSLETSEVRVWKDKSGLGHDASGGFVLRLNAGLNGARYPCVKFTGGNILSTNSFSLSDTNTITVIFVGQMPNLSVANQYLYSSGSNVIYIFLDLNKGTDFGFQADGGRGVSAFTNAFISVQKADAVNVTTEVFNPTYSKYTDSRGNSNSFNTSTSIILGTNAADARISELLIWDRPLSDSEENTIVGYLQQKWGFPLSLPAPIVYLVAADLSGGDMTWTDRSGNGWDATLAGGTSSKSGSNALVLDGSSYWTFGDIGLQTNFSISVWFRRTDVIGDGGCIVTETYTGGNYVNMAIYGGTYGATNTQFIGGFFSGSWLVGAPQTFPLNTWVQMTITWDGTDVKTYINGTLVDSTNHSGQTPGSTGLGYTIGKRWDNPAYVTGHLGEVRIDSVALTDTQVAFFYQNTQINYSLPNPIVYLVAADLANGDTTWTDRSGNSFDATLAGGSSSKNGSNALVLDGSSYWTFGAIGAKSNFSMSVWFKRTGPSEPSGCIVTDTFDSSTINMAIYGGESPAADTEFVGGFYNGTWRTGTPQTFALNTWVQMTVTWDGTDLKTYIDGALVNTTNHSGETATSGNLGYRIGRRWDATYYVTGELGEVRIDDIALSSTQVVSYYTITNSDYSV